MEISVNHRAREIITAEFSGRVDRTIILWANNTHYKERYDSLKLTVVFPDYWAELPHFFKMKQPVNVTIRADDGTVIFECGAFHYVSRHEPGQYIYTFYLNTEPSIDKVSGV